MHNRTMYGEGFSYKPGTALKFVEKLNRRERNGMVDFLKKIKFLKPRFHNATVQHLSYSFEVTA